MDMFSGRGGLGKPAPPIHAGCGTPAAFKVIDP